MPIKSSGKDVVSPPPSKGSSGPVSPSGPSLPMGGHGDQSLVIHVATLELLCQSLPRPRLLPSSEPGSLVDSVTSAAAQYYIGDDSIYLAFQPYTGSDEAIPGQGVETNTKTLPKNIKTVDFNDDVSLSLPASLGDVRQVRLCLYRRGIMDNEVLADALVAVPTTTEVAESSIILISKSEGTPMFRLLLSIQLVVTERLVMVHFAEELKKLVAAQAVMAIGKPPDETTAAERTRETVASIQRYVYACSGIRHVWQFVHGVLTWRLGYSATWLFLIAIVYSDFLWLVFLLLCCHVYLTATSTSEFTSPNEVDANLAFIKEQADTLAHASEALATRVSYRAALLVCACVLFLSPRPHVTICVVIILSHTYWAQALYETFKCRRATKRRKSSTMFASSLQESSKGHNSITVEVYENQRWWVGKWSDNLLAVERYAWSDETGTSRRTKEDVHLPPPVSDGVWQWSSLWRVDARPETHETDPDGWIYARDFASGQWTASRGMGDFVRRRRWSRTARLVPVATSSSVSGPVKGDNHNPPDGNGLRQRPQQIEEIE